MQVLIHKLKNGIFQALLASVFVIVSPAQTLHIFDIANVARTDTFDINLLRADALIRVGDGITTEMNATNRCRCFTEADPIAPHSSNPLKISLFQAAMSGTIIVGHNFLAAHHHARLAKLLVMGDIVSESYAVGLNSYGLNKYGK